MNGLNSVVCAMTGPRRLRSALKQKTALIRTLIKALDGPSELRVRIPASVFGGDIFGVMSKQLREALVFAPPAETPAAKLHRRRTLLSSENLPAQNPSNSFPLLAHGVNQSTLSSEPIDNASTPKLETLTLEPSVGALSLPETQLSSLQRSALSFFRQGAGETPAIAGKQESQSRMPARRRSSPIEPALVASLNRYWDSIREIREIRGSNQTTLVTQTLATATPGAHVPEPEQPTPPRAWPSVIGREVSAKLGSFRDSPLKSTRQNSRPDQQIQNVFNISVNQANQPSQNYDDLGERIAEILHEQALQHGIDVT